MPRATNSPAYLKRRKKMLKQAKGYFGNKSRLYKYAKEAVAHALQYAYRDRRAKKRDFRRLWTLKINAAVRPLGMSYSRFINALKGKNVELDRKSLAFLAEHKPEVFKKVVETVK